MKKLMIALWCAIISPMYWHFMTVMRSQTGQTTTTTASDTGEALPNSDTDNPTTN